MYRRLRVAAAEYDLTIRDLVAEAVNYWLDHREEIEDELAAAKVDRVEAGSVGNLLTHEGLKQRLEQ